MSTHRVHAAERLTLRATTDHTAGDLVWCKGWYGTVQDNVRSGDLFSLILNGAWNFKRVGGVTKNGALMAAPATEQATSLPLGLSGATIGVSTTGWFPVGRLIATSTATTGKMQLFNPNPLNQS
jgi:hypothetical protein